MRAFCTVVGTLWLAVVVSRATESPPGRCCPSRFNVHPNPTNYHFRCEVADLTPGCDNLNMFEYVPNTAINTDEGVTECSSSYLMADPNWQDLQSFQPNVACAYYLPPLEGCCWELWLVKYLDPIVCGDNCQCNCEDNVYIKEVGNQSPNEKTYCDLDGGTPTAGWCGTPVGPHNVLGTLPFFTAVNTGVRTTFRSDDTNGVGDGALVFGYAVPCAKKRSVRQTHLSSTWSLHPRNIENCLKQSSLCKKQSCKVSRECQNYIKTVMTVQNISRTLYAIFTNASRTDYNSHYEHKVLRRAVRHAMYNIERFGRPVPTFTQLQNSTMDTKDRRTGQTPTVRPILRPRNVLNQ